jgi:hypothetical protein
MPSKSKAQHDAMEAAAHGGGTLGIPKKVGREFVNADRMKAGGNKGRATQQHKRGTMSSGTKAKVQQQSDRALGHTFHSHKGTK